MPGKELSDAPIEWAQIVRGRRPKTEQWPKALGHGQNSAGQGAQQRQTFSGGAKRGRRSVQPLSARGRRPSRSVPMHPPKCHVCRPH